MIENGVNADALAVRLPLPPLSFSSLKLNTKQGEGWYYKAFLPNQSRIKLTHNIGITDCDQRNEERR